MGDNVELIQRFADLALGIRVAPHREYILIDVMEKLKKNLDDEGYTSLMGAFLQFRDCDLKDIFCEVIKELKEKYDVYV
tara:strand:+ start:3738 stop:3974 length:237 start_codon:yes stop_codon:yes gene_type:complete